MALECQPDHPKFQGNRIWGASRGRSALVRPDAGRWRLGKSGLPSHATLDRVFARRDPLALEACFIRFTPGGGRGVGRAGPERLLEATRGLELLKNADADTTRKSIKARRKIAGWDHPFLFQRVTGIGPVR